MPRAYSSDLRERVKRAVEKGASCRQVAAQYEVSVSFVLKPMQRWRRDGTLAPEPMGGRKPRRLAGHAERVRALIAAEPDLTIDGLRRRLADECAGIREAIEAKGAELADLPAYSPDLNPIEQVFAKLKALLRREGARRVDDLCNAIGRCLDASTPIECANDLAKSGYVAR